MSESRVWIGCSGYPVERSRYQAALRFVELQDPRRALPADASVDRMRRNAPEGFRFGLIAPDALCDPEAARDLPGGPPEHGGMRPTPANVTLLDRTLAVAARLGAVVRIHTTSDLVPGPDGLDRFQALLAAVDRRGVPIAWEQRGVLKDREVLRWCERLQVIPVLDPFQDLPAPGPVGFVRIHPFMTFATGLHAEQLARIAERIAAWDEAFVVFDTANAFREARALRRLVEGAAVAAATAAPGDAPPAAWEHPTDEASDDDPLGTESDDDPANDLDPDDDLEDDEDDLEDDADDLDPDDPEGEEDGLDEDEDEDDDDEDDAGR